ASIDTIFTVITSPDVDVARMWGHMLPSLTAADGAEYQRPQLYAELANQASAAQYTEDNEIWAGLYGPDSSKTDPAVNCAAGYFPSVEALDSLYSKYPNRTIKTAQGWPINRSYWSGSSSGSLTGGKPRSYYIVDLDDDSRRGVVNDGVNDRQYQICATTPKTQATQITLTSTLATDDTIQAVKAKNSESIPLLVTTTDAAGNPVPYTTFSLKRDAGTPRKADYPFTNSYTMTMTQSGGATQEFAYSSSVLYGATGANGTLALSLDEPGGVGVKSVVTASLYDTPTVTSSLPAVFTVITSPNSDKANMYGHMPETFTASNGAEFMRPLLYGELSSQNHTSSYFETNETWFTVNNFNTGNYGACPINQMATQDDLQSLYRDHPKGKITTDIGLPIKKKWWAGDSL
ncbi:adhesion domain-containing protein, partial [Salmonella enterica]